ncbi:MAG: hypothetical protein M3O31_13230 [Acidobacteriota bacterium]|nr:hypothetical protein [Acidobacteriota bacterium]
MRIILTILLLPAIGLAAQQPAAVSPAEGSNWQHVQALPVGQSIFVKAKSRNSGCRLAVVDADTLTCTQKKDIVFQRTEILSIKVPRRGRSALIGTGVGAAGLAIAGFAATTNSNSGWFGPNFLRGPVTAVGAMAGGAIGAGIGAATDFSRSTIYKAE